MWSPYTKKNIKEIERIQRRSARFVTGRYGRMDSPTEMMRELQWTSLKERRDVNDLVMFHRAVHGKVSIPISDILEATEIDKGTRGRSNQNTFLPKHAEVNQYLHSFFRSTVSHWNGLPQEVAASQTPRSAINKHLGLA